MKNDFLQKSITVLGEIFDIQKKLIDIKLEDLEPAKTCLVMVDMENGFAREGIFVTLKAWFNKENKTSRIIVPLNAVETYDLEIHDGCLIILMGV